MRTIDEKTEYYGTDRTILVTTIVAEEDSDITRYYVATHLTKNIDGEDSDLHYVVKLSGHKKELGKIDVPSKGGRDEQLIRCLKIHFNITGDLRNGQVPILEEKFYKDFLEQ